jgi:hypothetical protein
VSYWAKVFWVNVAVWVWVLGFHPSRRDLFLAGVFCIVMGIRQRLARG